MDKQDLLIKELHRENLCTYYILPLIKLNKHKFVTELNFIDSFLAEGAQSIFVQVVEVQFFEHRMKAHPQFMATWEGENKENYLQYSIPAEWQEDVALFLKGKYSELSTRAKERIRTNSGLQFRVRSSAGIIITDVRILALEKSKGVREMWESSLSCILDPNQELLSIPTEKTYIDQSHLRMT